MNNIEFLDVVGFSGLDDVVSETTDSQIVTSDRLRKQARQFLDSIDMRSVEPSKSTLETITNARDQLKLPAPGEQMRIRTQRSISLISIVLLMVEIHGKIDDLKIATYTLNKDASEILFDLVRCGKIGGLNLYLASSYGFRNPNYFEWLKLECIDLSESYEVHLAFAWLHFKITLAKCGWNWYQMEGSMNYSQNNMAEQLLLENNRETWKYDAKFMAENLSGTNSAIEIVC